MIFDVQTRAVLANRYRRGSGDFFQKRKKEFASSGFDFYVTFVPREEAAPRLIDREIKGALVPTSQDFLLIPWLVPTRVSASRLCASLVEGNSTMLHPFKQR